MKIKRWLAAIILILVVVSGLGFAKFSQIQAMIAFAESFPEPSASVKSTYAQPTQHIKTVKVIGQVQAPNTLTVSNEYAGNITKVGFKPGDIVEKDQLLIKLDTSIEEANLSAAKARLTLAESTLSRVEKLLAQKRISQDEVDKALANVNVANAEVANLTSVINKKNIKAPFTGRVDLTQYQVGQLLDANSQITTLVGLNDNIWIDFAVPQTLPRLAIGDALRVTPVKQQKSDTTLTAELIAIAPNIDINSRQQSYRAIVNNQNKQLHHNQMVSVFVPIEVIDAVAVPTNAVTRSHFGDFVYKLEKDDKQNWRAKPIKVELGDKIQDQQLILSGLNAGEFIASEGAFKLKENLLVYTTETAENTTHTGGL